MYDRVVRVDGKKGGETSIILAGVHGNEICGVKAFGNILPNLKIDCGSVFFAYGSPLAIIKNKRFIEYNLNRMFKSKGDLSVDEIGSYEYKRSQILINYLDKAGALLDIHASSNPKSKAFAICEPNAKNIVGYLPINLVVSGFDKVEPGGTDYYMNRTGKVGICLECGYSQDPKSVNTAQMGIIAFLKARGHIKNDLFFKKKLKYIKMFEKYYSKTASFRLVKNFVDFEELEQGQIIGFDGDNKVKANKSCIILFPHNGSRAGDEVFLLGKQEVEF